MSLLGKLLALVNFFGVLALFVLGFVDYGKRQAWAYSVLRHDLVIFGLPLDERQTGQHGDPAKPLVDQLSPATLQDIFSQVGNDPVATQVEEVQRIQKALNDRLAGMNDRQATLLLARVLLPLADSYLEREEFLAARYYFATDDSYKVLEGRYRTGFTEALARASEEGKDRRVLTFEEAMQLAVRTQGGEPSAAFTNTFLASAPAGPAELKKPGAFEAAWASAVKAQRVALASTMQRKFDRAIQGPSESAPPGQAQAAEAQKRAVARLLFAMCRTNADEAAESDPALKTVKSAAEYAEKLLGTPAYQQSLRRCFVVCGLKMALSAISDDAERIRKFVIEAESGRERELTGFVADHSMMVEEVRNRADLVRVELARITDNTRKRDAQADLVQKRVRDVQQLREELDASRAATRDAVKVLEQLSEGVLKKRTEVRDAIKKTEELEKAVREKEAVIRAHERSRSGK